MCLACEEADMYLRWKLVEVIAKGEMPEGYTADDLTTMGLPQPGEIEIDEQPDGTVIYRQKAPPTVKPTSAFACDSPDGE